MKMLLTRKLGMTSIISDQGLVTAVTLLLVEPNYVSQIKTPKKDGYSAIQIAAETNKKVKKPQKGHLKKAGLNLDLKTLRELRFKKEEQNDYKLKQELGLDDWAIDDLVYVSGTSKGKGFAGTVKRHNFSKQPQTHGTKKNTRKPGSIGSLLPEKVFKGQKMPGQMGNRKTTVKGLKIALIHKKLNIIGIKGAVPGPRKSLVIIKSQDKR